MNSENDNKIAWLCERCDLRIETDEEPNAKPTCPLCHGPVFRILEIIVSDLIDSKHLTEFIDIKDKNENYPSKRKLRKHIQAGVRKGADGRVVKVRRVINADTDEYEEEIIDSETGHVIRDRREPLSAHRTRGSERTKK